MPEPWKHAHLFEDDFEPDSQSSWYSAPTAYSTTYYNSGTRSAEIGWHEAIGKIVNRTSKIWVRFYWFLDGPTADADVFFISPQDSATAAYGDIFYISYDGSSFTAYDRDATAVATWANPGAFGCVEVGIDLDHLDSATGSTGINYSLYLDGAAAAEDHFIATAATQRPMTIAWASTGAGNTIYVDDVVISRDPIGLIESAANASSYVYDHDVELGGIGLNLAAETRPKEESQSSFNPRLGVGAPTYSDLSGFQHFALESQHGGIGQGTYSDATKYLFGVNVDTTEEGLIRLANKVYDHNTGFTPPASAYLPGGFICAESSEDVSLFGVAFGSAAGSAPYSCLYTYDGVTSNSYAFTCTYGVQDILDNGSYTFVSLGGARIVKSAHGGSLTFTGGGGSDSIVFDDGTGTDSITFSTAFSFSYAGSSVVVPTDMGQMAIYDEFVWVAERDTPWLHRAAQVDLSDLEGGNEDDDATYDAYATRIGGGRIPITSLCAHQGYLYIGREDGLYRLNVDGEDINVTLVESVTRHRDNYRGMCVYNGFLCYQENGQVYQFNGTNKQNISPGPISMTYPYERIQRWAGFWPHGKYLFAIGSPDPYSEAKPMWYIMANTQGPWHILGQLHTGSDSRNNLLPMPVVTLDATSTAYMRACAIADSDGTPHIYSQDARHGASGVGATEMSGYLISSLLDFGLPKIDRHLSLVREDAENITEGTNRILTSVSLDGGAWADLGIISASDCDFMGFPDATVARRLQLKHTLETDDENATPILKRTIVRYMDRPETIWGYTIVVSLGDGARTSAGDIDYLSPQQLVRILKDWRGTKAPLSFRDPIGEWSEVYITDSVFMLTPEPTCTLTLMGTADIGFTPPKTGPLYSVS